MEKLYKVVQGQTIEKDAFLAQLQALKYQEERSVEAPGEFAHRGAIVDIYPISYRAPIRIHFHFNTIESIRDFSPTDGKSLTAFEELFLLPVTGPFLKRSHRLRDQFETFEPLTELHDIRRGDYVVHFDYGVGKFLGSKMIEVTGTPKRHLAIEYADKEILYIPADAAVSLERYIGVGGRSPKLSKLNGKEWKRIKEKTRLALEGIARDMLKLQAKRHSKVGIIFKPNAEWEKEFAETFPFEETPDQLKAFQDVAKDMEGAKPMDRLICGDVGFGKTEVAIRAAFKAVINGKQVAFLAPTTILAEQHYVVLKRRMKAFAVRVELLSRFRSAKAQKTVVAQARTGAIDIVVGTHRLLSKDVAFKDLGLVVVDEEQRFGVKHKEKIKYFREMVDVLTLTATPIPRTLYISLMGVRDMSIINTPPKQRLPVSTEILEYDDHRVKQAIETELKRKGQVYFVHNRVQSIERVYHHLKKLLPDVTFGVAHGQMDPLQLEKVMTKFIDSKIDCLISTNIIESGLDIPNVNTILVNRADAFGLSDLYQLRGRVGRFQTERQAYAYFFVPKNWVMTQDAKKRFAAIERFSELGSGFKIAMEDLEIRGAGNILGAEQSGFIYEVGFDLYCRMLRKVVREQKAGMGAAAA
ncbi:MAG: transcription-repair coupling factor [Candidatus Omnitrophica bacterium CG11_big_fil_rev_8_21_14_0_20_45_26]|uniref:Transcription-repair-coupling factor n=1 Tax=Candidatus Abzuiibacterium crystallinum TaxID=1974748 RepID=A0A2H0LNC6_9BACT|nr:MAG: transcription-repair coupling factor [Candidatus Omnitrophica bacterium CG11_big_fil_rev_8_21_14_0_20_45_26]PIW65081.1 MAG: transcription-repair coupling factor [Candidatus Omnitrophica bacterium CG12_big_fil_rev_8_21_14_0_65_45_16]